MKKNKKINFGFITDTNTFNENKVTKKSYKIWHSIIQRCHFESCKQYKNYGMLGVKICDEWKLFSNFEKWYDKNYKENSDLDKDILCEELKIYPKIYSPQTCMFVEKKDNISFASKKTWSIKNIKFKGWKYYSENPTLRMKFKIICEKNKKDFMCFHEEWDGHSKTQNGAKKFTYTEINKDETRRFVKNEKDQNRNINILYFEKNHIRKDHFKKRCLTKQLNIEDFIAIESKDRIDNSCRKRHYFVSSNRIKEEIKIASKLGIVIEWEKEKKLKNKS